MERHNKVTVNKSENNWNNLYVLNTLDWSKIYINPFRSTIDTKLRAFQYKFLKQILPTNDFLHKCKIVQSSLCDLCNMHNETIIHLFWECPVSQAFWSNFSRFLEENNIVVHVDYLTIALGVFSNDRKSIVTNFLILIAKYLLYKCKLNKTEPNISMFKSELKQREQIERLIAISKNKIEVHNLKWNSINII